MNETKSKDILLWEQWRRTGSQADLDTLLRQMEPILRREVGRWSRVAPVFLLENEAKRLAIKAFHDYDPNHVPPTALASHVTNHLMKLSRTAYARQSILTVPEAKRLDFNNINRERIRLEDQLGRPPSLEELADHVRLPPSRIQNLASEVAKREYMESGEGPSFVQHLDDPEVVHLAWHDMTPVQRQIFEHRTGYGGTPLLKGQAIMKATGLTQGQLSHQLGKIKEVLVKAQGLRQ
jgi:DNA-directed RNA polymerase specialized sigma subunit